MHNIFSQKDDRFLVVQVKYSTQVPGKPTRRRRSVIHEMWQKLLRRFRRVVEPVVIVVPSVRVKNTNVTINGLSPYTRYQVIVSAVNSGGEGPTTGISTTTLSNGKNYMLGYQYRKIWTDSGVAFRS